MAATSYVYVWSFQVASELAAEYERIYGPDGDWVALFRGAPGYLSTQLLKDRETVGRYLTIDTWASAAAFDAFRAARAAEFEALDRRCEALTLSETLIGRFEVVVPLR